jgi:2,5-diketo-D-gluconate reductase A
MTVPTVRLNDGNEIPAIGFGVFQIDPALTERVVAEAIEIGYRHIDTAAYYRNEAGVGAAVRRSGVPREELFVTTKLWNADQGRRWPRDGIERSLAHLGLDYVDLYLIHWPMPASGLFVETWRAFEEILTSGKARSIGVSNFRPPDLDRLLGETDVVPAVNQIEVHPLLIQRELRDYDDRRGIVTESWGPLGHGSSKVLAAPAIVGIAASREVSPAQVVLRWHLQHGLVVIPKSSHGDRMRENLDILGFELDAEEMKLIDGLDSGRRFGPDPAWL